MRLGMFALIRPVITSTEGLCVANIKCTPAARAFCARRVINSSTFLPTTIIRSANSSITNTMSGICSCGSGLSGVTLKGLVSGVPAFCASRIFWLYPARLRTPRFDISRKRWSISPAHQTSALAACFISVTTGASKCGMPSYIESSNILGSINIIRTCAGEALYTRLRIMALIATDLPEPVVPATRICGILARSATTGCPPISLPKARVSGEFISAYACELRISESRTTCRSGLGTSKPMQALPGMVSTTRMLTTDSARARSFTKLTIWLPFTPTAGSIS